MVKKKAARGNGINKSQVIRDQIAKMPKATANQIAEAASKVAGEDVSATLVYQVKSKLGGGRKRRRKKVAVDSVAPANGGINTTLIRDAATLLYRAGDVKAAREALTLAEEVSRIIKK